MCKVCDRTKNFNPAPGDLRLWWIPQVPGKPFYHNVKNPEEARLILDTLGDYDWFLEAHGHRVDYSNAGGLEVFEDGEWVEWYDDDGNDIDEHFSEG